MERAGLWKELYEMRVDLSILEILHQIFWLRFEFKLQITERPLLAGARTEERRIKVWMDLLKFRLSVKIIFKITGRPHSSKLDVLNTLQHPDYKQQSAVLHQQDISNTRTEW